MIETTATECGVPPLVQGTFGVSDGSSLWAVRYATEGRARSLFASAEVDSLHQLYPEKKMWFTTAAVGDRLIASEPFSDLPGVWHEIDESSAVIVRRRRPARTRAVPPLGSAGRHRRGRCRGSVMKGVGGTPGEGSRHGSVRHGLHRGPGSAVVGWWGWLPISDDRRQTPRPELSGRAR